MSGNASPPLDAREAGSLYGGPSFSLHSRVVRAIWSITWLLLARWTPPPARLWRVALLRLFGAEVDWTARVYASAVIWYPPNLVMGRHAIMGPGVQCYCVDKITIGKGAVISHRSLLCAGGHDINDAHFQVVTAPIVIGERAWIAAEAFVGPGVTVGTGAVLGARGVAVRDMEPWTVHAGNPARVIGRRRQMVLCS